MRKGPSFTNKYGPFFVSVYRRKGKMYKGRVIYLFAGVLIASSVALFNGCGQWAYKMESPGAPVVAKVIIMEDPPVADDTMVSKNDLITRLYQKSEYLLSGTWKSKQNLDQMFFVLRNVYLEGLNPEDYQFSSIEELAEKIILSEKAEFDDIVRLELLLTDAFLLLSSHLAMGKTDAETIDPQWRASGRGVTMDRIGFIDSTLQNNRIFANLKKLTPGHREYNNLKKALAGYRQIEEKGGWERFSTVLPKLEKGMQHPDVASLRSRLAITQGYIEYETEEEELFDLALHEQVVLFQLRNGLEPDGVVGKATIAAMNITVEERIALIAANLERWRWLDRDLGERYIRVNIAGFELQAIENDSVVFRTEAIVGQTQRKTPVFSSIITYLVLNPDWTVPPTILKNDIIPSLVKNPDYLAEKNLKILRTDGTEVDPSTIDWNTIVTSGFPYRIYQEPGPGNALGRVKFMFPNQYSVYIHDTPNRNLFGRTDRSLSSGCIRINNPLSLAEWLMRDNPAWTPADIRNVVDMGKVRNVYLANPLPVHLLYLTAWADDDGVAFFGKDIYDLDQALLTALKQSPPERIHNSRLITMSPGKE
jgi:murein L,D-transpeptidase YcbB/YkuD